MNASTRQPSRGLSNRRGGFFCITFYPRALNMLPCTAAELREELGINGMRARRMLAEMLWLGLAYPGDSRKVGLHTKAPVWQRGRAPAGFVPPNGVKPQRPSVNLLTFSEAMKALASPCTKREMMAQSGLLSEVTARKLLAFMHRHGMIHVASWSRQANMPVQDWLLGPGADAPRPKAVPLRELNRRNAATRRLLTQRAAQLRVLHALAGTAANSEKVAA